MKKKFILLTFLAVFSSHINAQTFEWLNIKSEILPDGSHSLVQLDTNNIVYRDGKKFFWKRTYWNFLGTNLQDMTILTYIQLDCKKKIWKGVYLERHQRGALLEKKGTNNHQFPSNIIDLDDIEDRRTFAIVCS